MNETRKEPTDAEANAEDHEAVRQSVSHADTPAGQRPIEKVKLPKR